MNAALSNPSLLGTEIRIPVYASLSSAATNWSDGRFSIADVTAPVDMTVSLLNTVLDPLGAILGSAVDYLMNLLINTVKPLGDAVDLLLGNPDAIYEHAHRWQGIAERIAEQGNLHADTVTAAPSWQAPSAEAYRETQRTVNESFASAAGAAQNMGRWTSAVGAGVGMFRELMWGLLKDFITEILKAAILALAAAIPTAGGSIGAFTGWLGVKASLIASKFSRSLAKLMRWCATVSRKLGFSGQAFDRAARALSQASQSLLRGARLRVQGGATSYTRNPLPPGAQGPTGPTESLPLSPHLPGRTDPGEGVTDAVGRYNTVTTGVRDPIDHYNNEGTGRENAEVRDI